MDNEIKQLETSLCKICKNIIPAKAKKCIHCSSYQDFRRFINISTTFLSLLVALTTVISFGIPYYKNATEEKNSDIVAHLLPSNPTQNELKIYCVNEGNRPGIAHTIRITFNYKSEDYYLILRKKKIVVENKLESSPDSKYQDFFEIYPGKTILLSCFVEPKLAARKMSDEKIVFNYLYYQKSEISNINIELISTTFIGEQTSIRLNVDDEIKKQLFYRIVKRFDYEALINAN